MAIINLGQVGTPRKSKLSGLADYTSELAKTKTLEGVEAKAEAGREQRSMRQAETSRRGQDVSAETARMGQENQLQIALAQTKLTRETKERAMWMKQLTNVADNPKKKQQLVANKEAYGQFKKVTKRIMGSDIFDPKGNIIWEGFTTQNQLTNQVKQQEFDLMEKERLGTITAKGLEELRMIKDTGPDSVARRIIKVQGYQGDLEKAAQAIQRGADAQDVYRRLAVQYPEQSVELKRILVPDLNERKITAADVKGARAQVNPFMEILRGPGAQTTAGKRYKELQKRQTDQFFD